MKRLICHTEGCPNKELPFLWDYDTDLMRLLQQGADTGQEVTLADPTCGGCSQPYVDITTDSSVSSPGTGGITPAPTT